MSLRDICPVLLSVLPQPETIHDFGRVITLTCETNGFHSVAEMCPRAHFVEQGEIKKTKPTNKNKKNEDKILIPISPILIIILLIHYLIIFCSGIGMHDLIGLFDKCIQ